MKLLPSAWMLQNESFNCTGSSRHQRGHQQTVKRTGFLELIPWDPLSETIREFLAQRTARHVAGGTVAQPLREISAAFICVAAGKWPAAHDRMTARSESRSGKTHALLYQNGREARRGKRRRFRKCRPPGECDMSAPAYDKHCRYPRHDAPHTTTLRSWRFLRRRILISRHCIPLQPSACSSTISTED